MTDQKRQRTERGRVFSRFGGLIIIVGALMVTVALSVATREPVARAEPVLTIQKNTHAHGPQQTGYEIDAKNSGGEPTVAVTIVDDLDDLLLLTLHDENADWDCVLIAGNELTCTLTNPSGFANMTGPSATIVIIDACDTVVRGSVPANNTRILLNGVEQGNDQAVPNIFECDAEVTLGKSNDTGDQAEPGDSFDWEVEVTVSGGPATSTIVDTVPDGFTINGVTDDGGDNITCTVNLQEVTCELDGLTAGTYTITINVTVDVGNPPCGENVNGAEITAGDGQGETATDTVTVICAPPQLGSITICKNTDPEDSNVAFSFDGNTLGTFSITDDSPADDCQTFDGLAAADYTISEDGELGWTFTGIDNCGGATIQINGMSVTITLGAGDDVTCTFTNTEEPQPQLGSITICKNTDPEDSNVAFSFDGNTLGTFSITDDSPADDCQTFDGLAAADYTISEDGELGWTFTGIDNCGGATIQINGMSVTITLGAGDDVTCTFTNTLDPLEPELGSITIFKDVDGDNQAFDFDDNIPGCNIGPLADGESDTCDNLEPGVFFVDENQNPDYDLHNIVCSGDVESVIDIDNDVGFEGASGFQNGDDTVIIQLAAGEDITCTFFNDEEPQEEDPTPTPTSTPTSTPTPFVQVQVTVVTATVPPTPVPATPTPTLIAETLSVIQAPPAGSGGLLGDGQWAGAWGWRAPIVVGFLLAVGIALLYRVEVARGSFSGASAARFR